MRTPSYRRSVLLGAALVSTALGTAFVESVSNAGYFGPGYHDDDHLV